MKIGNSSQKERDNMFLLTGSKGKKVCCFVFSKIKELAIIVCFGGFYGFLKINKQKHLIYLFKSKALWRQ